MGSFGAGLAGFANGFAGGMSIGRQLKQAVEEDKLAKVREQGIAEARAAQAAAAPKVQDNGDMQNLTDRPQMSRDPAADTSVNTDLGQVGAAQRQQPATDGGMQTYPVQPPQYQNADQLSDVPMSSMAPGAQPAPTEAPFAKGLPQAPVKRFNVDGKGFDTQEDAAAYVKKSTPPLSSFFKDALIPKMTEALIAQGKPDQAAAWQKYADESDTQEHMKTWSKAIKLAQFGDFTSSAQELMKLHPHFDDGLELVKAEPTKGANGEDGFTMTVRDEDGKEQQVYHDAKTITEVGLSQLAPIEMFNKRFTRQNQAETLQAKEVIDARNDERTAKRIMDATKLREAGQNTRTDKKIEASADRQETKIDADKDRDKTRAGYKEEQIKLAASERSKLDAQRIAAQGQYRKAVSPEERQAIVVTSLSKDPMFSMMSADEKKQRVAETMALIPQSKPASTARTTPNPMEMGLPSSGASAPKGKKAVNVYDPETKSVKTVYRD